MIKKYNCYNKKINFNKQSIKIQEQNKYIMHKKKERQNPQQTENYK